LSFVFRSKNVKSVKNNSGVPLILDHPVCVEQTLAHGVTSDLRPN